MTSQGLAVRVRPGFGSSARHRRQASNPACYGATFTMKRLKNRVLFDVHAVNR